MSARDKRCDRCGGFPWTRLHQRACVAINFAAIVRRELARRAKCLDPAMSARELVQACMRSHDGQRLDIPTVWYRVKVAIEDLRAAGKVTMLGVGKGARYELVKEF